MSEKSKQPNRRRRGRSRGGNRQAPVRTVHEDVRQNIFRRLRNPIGLIVGMMVVFGAIWAGQAFAEETSGVEATAPIEETVEIGFKSRLSKAWGYLTDGDPTAIVTETDDAVAARLAQTEVLEATLESERDALIEERADLKAERAELDAEYGRLNKRKAALTQCVAAALEEADE